MAVHFIRLGQIVETDLSKTLQAFKDLGIENAQEYMATPACAKLIHEFKTGQKDEKEFFNEAKSNFGIQITKEQFYQAWNAMCNVSERSVAFFQEIEQLQNAGETVVIISDTNPVHMAHIRKQIRENSTLDVRNLFKDAVLSHKEGEIGDKLISQALNAHKDTMTKSAENNGFFVEAPRPLYSPNRWTITNYLFAPRMAWRHGNDVKANNALIKQHKDCHLKTVDWPKDKSAKIYDLLAKNGCKVVKPNVEQFAEAPGDDGLDDDTPLSQLHAKLSAGADGQTQGAEVDLGPSTQNAMTNSRNSNNNSGRARKPRQVPSAANAALAANSPNYRKKLRDPNGIASSLNSSRSSNSGSLRDSAESLEYRKMLRTPEQRRKSFRNQ